MTQMTDAYPRGCRSVTSSVVSTSRGASCSKKTSSTQSGWACRRLRRPLVAFQAHQARPQSPGDQDRVAAHVPVLRNNGEGITRTAVIEQGSYHGRIDPRLITHHDEGRFGRWIATGRVETDTHRRSHPFFPFGVLNDTGIAEVDRVQDFLVPAPQHHPDGIDRPGQRLVDDLLQKRRTSPREELFRSTKTSRRAGGENRGQLCS